MTSAKVSFGVLLMVGSAGHLQGCAVGPAWHAPRPPLSPAYATEPIAQSTAWSPVHGGEMQSLKHDQDLPFNWWATLQSPALDALVAQSFHHNPTLLAAQSSLTQAQELVYAQMGYFAPTVAGLLQAERHKVSGNTNSSSTIGVQGNGVNLLPEIPEAPSALLTKPHNLPSYYTFYTAEVTVGFVPDVFGLNRREVESLSAQAQARRFALEAAYLTLASGVVGAVIQEASLRAQIRTTQQLIEAQKRALGIVTDQFRLGFAMRIDITTQQAALAQAQSTLPPLEKQRQQNLDLLRALVGNLPADDVASFELENLTLPPDLPLSLPSKLVEQRPDVRAAEAQLHSATATSGATLAGLLPQFSITGESGANATKIDQIFSSGGPFWNLYGSVTQPVFQGGTLWHQYRASKQAVRQSLALYREAVLTAYQNVADTLQVLLFDAKLLAADTEAEQAAKLIYELTLRQSKAGFVPTLALLTAQSAYNQALLTRIQAQAHRFSDTVALFQALGGGWWNRSSGAVP